MNITFTGGKELAQALRGLPGAIRGRVLTGAVLAGGGIIQRDASLRAPRDAEPRRRRGKRLADSIRTVVAEELSNSVAVNVMTRDPVAHLVEYGHQNVPRGPNRRRVSVTRVSKTGRISTKFAIDPDEKRRKPRTATGFTPPKPFLRPAFDNNKEAVIAKIAEVLRVGIEAEAKRLGGDTGDGFASAPGMTGAL